MAVKGGRKELLRILLDVGSNPNIVNGEGETVLTLVAQHYFVWNWSFPEMLNYFLSRGADIKLGVPLIGLIRSTNEPDPSLMKLFLERGVDINQLGLSRQYSALTEACWKPTKYGTVQFLLDNGADPNPGCGCVASPLEGVIFHMSTLSENPQKARYDGVGLASLLLEGGANVNEVLSDGSSYSTALRYAIATGGGSSGTVEILLEYGVKTALGH